MEPKAKNWYLSTITEVFRDQYVDPSNEWTALPKKALQNEFLRFAQKKHQAETRHLEDPNDQYNLHFDFYYFQIAKLFHSIMKNGFWIFFCRHIQERG